MRIRGLLITMFAFLACLGQAQNSNYSKIGIASFYADKFEGRQTANGEIYYHVKKTAAHRQLSFGTIVKVTNLKNQKFVVVRINDRGPFVDNRIIDLSKSAAEDLGFVSEGLAKVKLEVIANSNDLPEKKTKIEISAKKNYYWLDSKLANPKGKGVQVGSYSDDENVLLLVSKLKSEFKTDVYVESAQVKNKKFYRIIVGNSENEAYLIKLKNSLKKNYPDCFIVEFK